jgi:hypothetical protein
MLPTVTLGVLEEGGEVAAFLLSLGRQVERRERELMLAPMAPGEALLSLHHRSSRRFDVAAMGHGADGCMLRL